MKRGIILIPFIISNLVHAMTMRKSSYTTGLPLQPPSYVFGIVWSTIYLLYGIYLYNILYVSKEPYLSLILLMWVFNFILNLSWSPIVFHHKKYTLGVYMIVLMMGSLIGMMMSTKNVLSKNLLLPYVSWLILALLLNVELVKKKTAYT